MYYWNQDNFKGLKEIGGKYSVRTGYEDFSKYCILKEKGLRKQAHKAIEDFIALTKSKSIDEQRTIAEELAYLSYNNKEVHQLIPQQLHSFIITIFKDWAESGADNVIPYRWLGYFCRDLYYYEKAIKIGSTDEISIAGLVKGKLGSVDYQTHHLCETSFIGSIKEARNSLECVFNAIEKLEQKELKAQLSDEYNYYKNLIDAWEKYTKEQHEVSFPEWCEAKGEKFNFWTIVYYK